MSYQQKIRSQESGPWSVASGKKQLRFHIPSSGNWEVANSYLVFKGTVDMSPIITYADGYTGRLTFGFDDGTDSYKYSSGASVFVRHCWFECESLGKVESKRYANLINEHLAHLQKSQHQIEAQDYFGGQYVQVTNNEFNCRLQLRDLLELPKDEPLLDLEYMGDCVLTLELEITNANAQFLKYEEPITAVGADDQIGAVGAIEVLVFTAQTPEELGLHMGQVYQINWDGSVTGAGQTGQHIITDITYNGGDATIEISPLLGNVAEDVTNIEVESVTSLGAGGDIDGVVIDEVDLVTYKPAKPVSKKGLMFREMLVDTDQQLDGLDFHKIWNVEPNVQWAIFMNPKEDQFANLESDLAYYRNQINGYDTIDRNTYLRSGLYYDRLIMNVPNLKNLRLPDRYHVSERMPLNGQMNSLNTHLAYNNLPGNRTAYLFKHQLKEL